MKKIIFSIVCLLPALSFAHPKDYEGFSTIQEAEKYCPDVHELGFKPFWDSNPYSTGIIIGNKGENDFVDLNKAQMPHPSLLNNNNSIIGAQFRMFDGLFGYKEDNQIFCYYAYPSTPEAGVINITSLVMQH